MSSKLRPTLAIRIASKTIIVLVIVIAFVRIPVSSNNIFPNEFNEPISVSNKIPLFNDSFCVITWFRNCSYIVWTSIVNGIFIAVPIDVPKSSWAVFNILEAVESPCIKTNTPTLFSGVLSSLPTLIDKNILIKPISSKGISMLFSSSIIEDKSKATWNSFFIFLRTLFKSGWTITWPSLTRSIVLCKWSAKAKRAVSLYVCSKRSSAIS